MKRNLIETLMGAIVLAVAAFFVFNTYKSSGVDDSYGYQLKASFDRIDGINIGSDVRIGGIKVGSVTSQKLDPDSYRPQLTIGLQNQVRIPTDSSAEIVSDGLLGGKYVSIVPGADIEYLKTGGEIEYTQSSLNLEQLIGKVAFGSSDSEEKPAAKQEVAAEAAPKTETPKQEKLTPSLLDEPATVVEPQPVKEPVATPAPVVEAPKAEEPKTEAPKAEEKMPAPVVIRMENKTDADNKPVVSRKVAPESSAKGE